MRIHKTNVNQYICCVTQVNKTFTVLYDLKLGSLVDPKLTIFVKLKANYL